MYAVEAEQLLFPTSAFDWRSLCNVSSFDVDIYSN